MSWAPAKTTRSLERRGVGRSRRTTAGTSKDYGGSRRKTPQPVRSADVKLYKIEIERTFRFKVQLKPDTTYDCCLLNDPRGPEKPVLTPSQPNGPPPSVMFRIAVTPSTRSSTATTIV